jgi:predicted nucleic acid-binding protein
MEKTQSKTHPTPIPSEQFFLDTNVIWSRGCEYEYFHKPCKKLLTSANRKYTSKTVKKELKKVIKRRKTYYVRLLSWKHKPKKERQLKGIKEYLKQISFNENDTKFLNAIRGYILRDRRGQDWLGFYRLYIDLIESQISECLTKEITKPLLPQAKQGSAYEFLNSVVENRVDCQIVLDMIDGFRKSNQNINFTTGDYKDIILQNNTIQQWYTTFFKKESFFEILSITEAVKRLR